MLDMLANLATIANLVTALTCCAGASVVVGPLGIVPRAGPGRALSLALRSVLARSPYPQSVRTSDVAAMRRGLAVMSLGRYLIVQGPKGVGKSCAIATALQRTCGVMVVEVAPGTPKDAIVHSALEAVAGTRPNFLNPRPSAVRVLWWYRLLLPPPIIVLRVTERSANAPFAQTAGAVRSLAECGLRVIVDSSPNSLEPETLVTLREWVLDFAPMTRQQLQSVPEYAGLLEVLRSEGLEDVTLTVLGGVPALYAGLQDCLSAAAEPKDVRAVVAKFVRGKLLDAISRLLNSKPSPALQAKLALFQTAEEVPAQALADIQLPSPFKVLREVRKGEEAIVFVPADAAMALVLRHGFEAPPSIEALCALCATLPGLPLQERGLKA